MAIELIEGTHTYKRTDGRVVPSVTQIIGDAGLVWEARDQMALDRGTAVHRATRYLDEGILDWATVDPRIAPYVQAWRRFLDETGFCTTAIEEPVYSERWDYAGQPDRVGILWRADNTEPSSATAVVDLKTGTVQPFTALQLAAYGNAILNDDQCSRLTRIAVGLHDDGTYEMTTYRMMDWADDLGTFLACLRVARWKERRK